MAPALQKGVTRGRARPKSPAAERSIAAQDPAIAAALRENDAPAAFAGELLAWYDRERRDLPFRRTRDPYAIWVSEVMLQQTQVSTMLPYFARWMERFPDVSALARSSEHDVLHAFQGLGYYSRARNLRRAAQAIVEHHRGAMPSAYDELLALPGIGAYSAGAIASIGFGARVPVVDGNVVRVLTRVFAWRGDPKRAPLKTAVWQAAQELVPALRPGDFNQALMELGATICVPRRPNCFACPLARVCRARAAGVQEELPEPSAKPKTVEVRMAAALTIERGRVAVVQARADAPRWASMWQFPAVELEAGESAESGARRAAAALAGLRVRVDAPVQTVRHTVTHHRITLDAYACSREGRRTEPGASVEALAWKRPAELTQLPMPSAHRRLASALLSSKLRRAR